MSWTSVGVVGVLQATICPPIRWDVCLHYFRVISPLESSGCLGILGALHQTPRTWCRWRWTTWRTGQVPTTLSTCLRSMARLGTCSSLRTSSLGKAEALPLSGSTCYLKIAVAHIAKCEWSWWWDEHASPVPGSTTREMQKTQWTLWTDECTTEEIWGFKWLNMGGLNHRRGNQLWKFALDVKMKSKRRNLTNS